MSLAASYRLPAVTVSLGTVLDVRFEYGRNRVTVDEWAGWLLLTDDGAMESARPRLWLVPGKVAPKGGPVENATYEEWHAREAAGVVDVEWSGDPIGYRQGRVLSIGYRSDKWGRRGEFHDYDHDFLESGAPPMLYTDRASFADARAVCIVGGDMRVTPEGID